MIEVKDVVKYYGDFLAVDKISFYIEKGEIIGLLGPNGAGKSTTIRMICGYLSPDQGSVTVDGVSSNEDPLHAKKSIGYLPESAPLYDEMLVFDYLSHVAQIREIPSEKVLPRIKEVAEICGLISMMHKNIGELSKGYRQRVGLAHALIGDPDILILDEPTSGLDPNQIVEIRSLIKKVGKTKTVILCSHILSEVEATCDRVIIVNQGKIVTDSSKEALKDTYRAKKITVEFDLPVSEIEVVKNALVAIDDIADVLPAPLQGLHDSQNRLRVDIRYESNRDLRPDISRKIMDQGWLVLEFHQEEKSLENIFRELTGRSAGPLVEK